MTPQTVTIREASECELSRIHALVHRALVHDELSETHLHQKLFFNPHPDRDTYTTLIAEIDSVVVGAMGYVIRAADHQGWLSLFAVDERYRRRSVARQMFAKVRQAFVEQSVVSVEVMTLPTNYLVPGIDPRYTAAMCFVESIGFEHTGVRMNMLAHLNGNYDTTDIETTLASNGITIRRAIANDESQLEAYFDEIFGDGWLAEVRIALMQQPHAVHLALKDSRIIGFAAHSTMNQEWGNFGPMGLTEQTRGLGIGRVLLFRCMKDLQESGHRTAVIPWVGPISFYSRLLDCAVDRVFWQYRLEL